MGIVEYFALKILQKCGYLNFRLHLAAIGIDWASLWCRNPLHAEQVSQRASFDLFDFYPSEGNYRFQWRDLCNYRFTIEEEFPCGC